MVIAPSRSENPENPDKRSLRDIPATARRTLTMRRGMRHRPTLEAMDAPPDLDAWRARPAAQQPAWPDQAAVADVAAELSRSPALVVPDECDTLRDRLAAVSRGDAFLLQGGD